MEEQAKKAVFSSDGLTIKGPRVDGNFTVSFDVGFYQYNNIKDLPLLNGKMLVVAVVQGEDIKKKGHENPAPDEQPEGIRKIEA